MAGAAKGEQKKKKKKQGKVGRCEILTSHAQKNRHTPSHSPRTLTKKYAPITVHIINHWTNTLSLLPNLSKPPKPTPLSHHCKTKIRVTEASRDAAKGALRPEIRHTEYQQTRRARSDDEVTPCRSGRYKGGGHETRWGGG